jgi:hypothetical protein
MSHKLNSAIAVIGIDIGKNSFRVVGHDQRGAIVLPQTGGNTARQPVAVSDRYGGPRRRASSQSKAADAWARYSADAGEVRAAVFEGTEEPQRERPRPAGGPTSRGLATTHASPHSGGSIIRLIVCGLRNGTRLVKCQVGRVESPMKPRTHFKHTIDRLDLAGEIIEQPCRCGRLRDC